MSKIIKILISLFTSKEGRSLLVKICIVLLSPLILLALLFMPINEATNTHNEKIVDATFNGIKINMIDNKYKAHVLFIQESFKNIDNKIALMIDELDGDLDSLYLKATYFTLYFTDAISRVISENEFVDFSVDYVEYEEIIEDDLTTEENEYQVIKYIKIHPVSNDIFIQRLFDSSNIDYKYKIHNKKDMILNVYNYVLDNVYDSEQVIGGSAHEHVMTFMEASLNKEYVGGEYGSPFVDGWEDKVTSEFGIRNPIILPNGDVLDSFHAGIDLANNLGADILAINDGKVVAVEYTTVGLGLYVIIDHGAGNLSVYGHNSRNVVHVGQKVIKGEKIAEVGSSGFSTGPHLHLQVYQHEKLINPRDVLN